MHQEGGEVAGVGAVPGVIRCNVPQDKEWDERTKLFRDQPAHDWSSHFADAFRYLSVGHEDVPEAYKARPRAPVVKFDPYTGLADEPSPTPRPWDDAIRRSMGR